VSDFTVWSHTWRKNWINCAVLTGSSAGLRTVFSSRLSHRELRSWLRQSHSFLSLPADTTMASSQGTSVSGNSFSRWASHDIFLFKYHFLLHILLFLFFFSDNIIWAKQNCWMLNLLVHHLTTRRFTSCKLLGPTERRDSTRVPAECLRRMIHIPAFYSRSLEFIPRSENRRFRCFCQSHYAHTGMPVIKTQIFPCLPCMPSILQCSLYILTFDPVL
jgi:hypothetical protein